MNFNFEIRDERIKEMVEEQAKSLNISVDQLIWNYINRGLMGDSINEEALEELHSQEYLNEIEYALGLE
jgi:hypothetical protein